MKKVLASIAVAVVLVLGTAPAQASQVHKVWVCKYVGKPGVDERLKDGKNPISVDSDATVGTYFNDAQGRSFVLAVDDGEHQYSADDCPSTEVTTSTTTSTSTSLPGSTTTTAVPTTTTPPGISPSTTSSPTTSTSPSTTTTISLGHPATTTSPVPPTTGNQQTVPPAGSRSLPFTGGHGDLAVFGFGALGLGTVLTAAARKRVA